ncbi:hypothetical protein ASF74_07860 [Arthrobacter sp. Leaf145]|nr:hypothetical protein ASF74_07860 [Arthrobacter sp. Leaf145]
MDNQTSNQLTPRFGMAELLPQVDLRPALQQVDAMVNDLEGQRLVQGILDRKQEQEESWEDNQPCTCTTDCSEHPEENPCYHCKDLDIYAPCPVIGFGCGGNCDCCTPEQQKAAAK